MTFKTYLSLENTNTSRDFLYEAFNFRPQNKNDIPKNMKNYKDVIKLFDLLDPYFDLSEYFAIDIGAGKVKISPDIRNDIELRKLKSKIINNKAFDRYGNGSKNSDRRSMMSAIEEFGEQATILAFTQKVETPKDSKQQFFIDDPAAFYDWKSTFVETKKAMEVILKYGIKDYHHLHEATDKSEFEEVIKRFVKKVGMSKHNWTTADLFSIHKKSWKNIIYTMNLVIDSLEGNQLISAFNGKLYDYYKKGLFYPISLKKIKGQYSIEYANEPGDVFVFSEMKIDYFITNVTPSFSKEIGAMKITNLDTGKTVSLQHNQQPPGFSTTQTEVTSDGSNTAGKIGKVSTYFVSNIMKEYGEERISSMKYFGTKNNWLKNFDKAKRQKTIDQFKFVISQTESKPSMSLKEYKDLVNNADDLSEQEIFNFVSKVQGLNFQHFLLKNKKDITKIINEMILIAKKIGPTKPFLIKIY